MDSPPNIAAFLEHGLKEEVVVISRNYEIICANDLFLQNHGMLNEEVAGRHCFEVIESCKKSCGDPSRECPVREAIATNEKVSITQLDAFGGDAPRHFRVDVYPVLLPDVRRTYFMLVYRDITNRIEEERIKEKMWIAILGRMEHLFTSIIGEGVKVERVHQELNHLIEILPIALVKWDLHGRIVLWNATAEILFGWQQQEITGKQFKSLFTSGPSQENLERIMKEILHGRTMAYSLADNRTAIGRIISCDWHHSVFLGEEGEVAGGISLAHEITERIATLESLKKKEDLLRGLLEAANEAVIAVNQLGKITVWNKAAERLFGWSAQEIKGKEPELLLPPEIRDEHRQRLRDFFAKENKDYQPHVFEAVGVNKEGRHFPVEICLRLTSIGNKPAVIAVLRDVTKKKRLERNLLASEKMRVFGEMANGVAHDFNNILAVILGNTQLLKKLAMDGDAIALLDKVEAATNKGAKAVAGLLKQEHPNKGQQDDNGFVLDELPQFIQKVLDFTRFRWQDQAQKAGCTITFTTDLADTPPLLINPASFREMLTNIIFNAVDALPRGGRIHITTRLVEEAVLLTIEDNGTGIPPEEIAHIFQPFFTTKGLSHSGLGLSIAQSIAARHGGAIKVKSNIGTGTAFTIRFPLMTTGTIHDITDGDKEHPARVLVMDDEPLVRELLQHLLTHAGHSVATASDGREGVRSFQQGDFDLVITDLGMPMMGGLDAAIRIKQLNPAVPIILITGWGTDLESERPKADLVDAVISKPFDIDKLLTLVRHLSNNRLVADH